MKCLRPWITAALLPLLTGLVSSCADNRVSGTTTTTSNGGGVVALGPDGKPLSDCIALAARTWNPVTGKPGLVDTLRSTADGIFLIEEGSYAFLEIHNPNRTLGAWFAPAYPLGDSLQSLQLDTLRNVRGRWPDHAGVIKGRMLLDSSFQTAALGPTDGSFSFDNVPMGRFKLLLDTGATAPHAMGTLQLQRRDVRYQGSGNILIYGDTTGSPLWIDDFETGDIWPLLKTTVPRLSPWYMWWTETDMVRPTSNVPDSIRGAIGPDSNRTGKSIHARFTTTGPSGQVAIGITNMEIDLRDRSLVCFAYRADAPLRIEFQRDSLPGIRPTLSSTLPLASAWRDTCAMIADFTAGSDTPDSLKAWSDFARRVLVIQFSTSAGATYLDLDDIRLR